MKIQSNASGTRSIEISDAHLETIEKYQLLRDLIDSSGYVDEQVLEKLKLNIRSLLEGQAGSDKALLDLCLDVIYHPNMKAFGLQQLVLLYINWKNKACLHRPPLVWGGSHRAHTRGSRFSRGYRTATRLARRLPRLQEAGAPQAVLRHRPRVHGLDGEQIHRQPPFALRGRL